MLRFIIFDNLPYLTVEGKAFKVRWNDKGFTVGDEIKIDSIPAVTFSELEIKAKCTCLDSIASMAKKASNKPSDKRKPKGDTKPFNEMKIAEIKEYALERGIELGTAKTKADMIDAIMNALI